jgi:hypothetical protein
MSDATPLSDVMNAMISRLEFTQPEAYQSAPEERHWTLITLYISVDSVLASLYKQYQEAKENLGKLLVKHDAQDPMTEIAWDMHDSLRSAVETRLLELKDDKETSGRVAAIQISQNASRMTQKIKKTKPTQTLDEMMAFMLWAGMVMKNGVPAHHDIRKDFCKAS